MTTITEIRQKFPQYSDLDDNQLAQGLHQKFYSDMPFEEFSGKIGLSASPVKSQGTDVIEDTAKSVGSNLIGGGIDLAMTLPNLVNQAVAGPQLLGRGIAEKVSPLLGADAQPRGELWQPFYSSYDVEKAIGTDYEPQTTTGKAMALPSRIAGGIAGARGLQKVDAGTDKLLKDTTSGKISPQQATSSDIAKLSQQKYALAEQSGGILKPQVTNKFIGELDSLARQTPEGQALAGESPFTKTSDVIRGFRDKPLTLRAAQEIDEELSDRIDDLFVSQPKQAKKLFDIQTKLRETIDTAADVDVVGGKTGFDALKEGRRLWSASARLRDVERIISRAEMTENPATAIKTGFRNLATNKSRMRGFSKEEARLIEKAAKTGVVSDLLGIVGSRLGPIIAGATGGLSSGVATQATSLAARSAKTKLQVNRATKVANSVANRAMNPPGHQPQQNLDKLLAPLGVALLESESGRANRIALPLEDLRERLNGVRP